MLGEVRVRWVYDLLGCGGLMTTAFCLPAASGHAWCCAQNAGACGALKSGEPAAKACVVSAAAFHGIEGMKAIMKARLTLHASS
mmetsp:Transcript_9457/g.24129  ORF Transcript_9457/g.24129 Transcript_9457/m.24129 type:complete len:84 (-) Transcript_9457:469-720(-)